MLDSEATRDFLSTEFVARHKVPNTTSVAKDYVRLADGRIEECSGIGICDVTLRKYTEKRTFTITQLDEFDAILGLPWLRTHNPGIDWAVRTIKLTAGGETQLFYIEGDNGRGSLLSTPTEARIAVIYTDIVQEDKELLEDVRAGYKVDEYFGSNGKAERIGLHHTDDGLWFKNGVLVIPDYGTLRRRILQEVHNPVDVGHPGVQKTMTRISRMCWWRGIRAQVIEFIKHCDECQKNKPTNLKRAGLIVPIPPPTYCFQRVSLDLMTDLPRTARGNDSIVVFVCMFSKMVIFCPIIKNITGEGLARVFISEVYGKHGLPEGLVSDRDPRFTGNFWQSFFKILGTRLNMTTAYHPEADGQTERMNRTLEEMLRAYIGPGQDDWDDLLPMLEFAYNSSVHSATGYTPFYLNNGREPRTSLSASLGVETNVPAVVVFIKQLKEAHEFALENLKKA